MATANTTIASDNFMITEWMISSSFMTFIMIIAVPSQLFTN